MEQKTGTIAVLALIAAAVLLGISGFIMAASPRVGGGVLSSIALILGVLAVGIAVLGLIGIIIF